MEKMEFTREELYHRVWEKPMFQVAQEIGISDVGLKKACRRVLVPTPPRGYWAKVDAGQKPPVPALGPKSEKTPTSTTITVDDRSRETRIPRGAGEIGDIKVCVPKDLKGCHPIITRTRASFENNRYAHHGMFHAMGDSSLYLEVTKELCHRALRIYQGIIDACTSLGWEVKPGSGIDGTRIIVGDESVPFRIREKKRRIERESNWRWKEYDHVPKGKLTLEIVGYYFPISMRHSWNDTDHQVIETQLVEFLENVHLYASVKRQERIDVAERRRQRRLEEAKIARMEAAQAIEVAYTEQKRKELAQKLKWERQNRKTLIRYAKDWKNAQILKEFLAEYKSYRRSPEERIGLEWAMAIAEAHDPERNIRMHKLLSCRDLNSSLDCDLDVNKVVITVPVEVHSEMASIMSEPLDEFLSAD
jgi:hypothetical protein